MDFNSYKLSDILEIIGGGTPKRSEPTYWNGEIPWLSVVDFNNNERFVNESTETITKLGLEKSSTKLLDKGDLIISARGTVGALAQLTKKMAFNQSCYGLRAKLEITENNFLYYLVKFKITELQQKTHGAVFDTITRETFKHIHVKIPHLKNQRKIAQVLGDLDKKITLNNQINETLEAMAQAIFKSWFIDFEPVKAKIEAKEAGQDVEGILLAAMSAISGKDSKALKTLQTTAPEEYAELKAIAEQFPDSLEESELGMIPKGWEVRSFGKLLQYSIGGDWGKESEDKDHTVEVKILRGTDLLDVHRGKTENVPVRYLNEKKYKTRKLQVGDIVIEISGGSKNQPTGRSLFITENILNNLGNEIAPTSFCRLFRAIDHHIGLLLALHLQIIYQNGKTWLYQNQSTGISNFQTKVFLENEKVIIPDGEVLREFYKHIMTVFSKITTSENKALTELRDTLLPKLLSGEIDVSNVEIDELPEN